jgi:hypothetical protein
MYRVPRSQKLYCVMASVELSFINRCSPRQCPFVGCCCNYSAHLVSSALPKVSNLLSNVKQQPPSVEAHGVRNRKGQGSSGGIVEFQPSVRLRSIRYCPGVSRHSANAILNNFNEEPRDCHLTSMSFKMSTMRRWRSSVVFPCMLDRERTTKTICASSDRNYSSDLLQPSDVAEKRKWSITPVLIGRARYMWLDQLRKANSGTFSKSTTRSRPGQS